MITAHASYPNLEEIPVRQFAKSDLTNLLSEHESPCISLYQPTHRRHPENQQDPIRYRNLVDELEGILAEKYSKREVPVMMEQLRALQDDGNFWNHRTEGLAILCNPQTFQVFDLQRTVEPYAIVADNFYVKPLLRNLQSADRYQVLSISRHEVKLFEGNRDAMDGVDFLHVPATMTGALGHDLGHDDDVNLERFLRAVDQAVLEHHSRPSGLPLMLAGLPEHHAAFRKVSHNPFLIEPGINVNADTLSFEALRAQAWENIQPYYLARLAGLVDDFNLQRSRGLGSDDPAEVAKAAVQGRVSVLLVEADRKLPGQVDASNGEIRSEGLISADLSDVLDDVAETVLRAKGDVVIVPAERMPSQTGLAAVYRF